MSQLSESAIDKIKCPKCGALIPITDAFQHQLKERIEKELGERLAEQEKDWAKRSEEIERQKKEVVEARESIDNEVGEKLKQEREKLEEKVKERVNEKYELELQDMKNQIEG